MKSFRTLHTGEHKIKTTSIKSTKYNKYNFNIIDIDDKHIGDVYKNNFSYWTFKKFGELEHGIPDDRRFNNKNEAIKSLIHSIWSLIEEFK